MFRVTFHFKSSKRSNNGTDVGSGQIPEFLFRLPDMESEKGEELQMLGREFSSTVCPVSMRRKEEGREGGGRGEGGRRGGGREGEGGKEGRAVEGQA